jgi:hypothetical protein
MGGQKFVGVWVGMSSYEELRIIRGIARTIA